MLLFFFFKQKTAYEMRISDWSSDVCSSDLTIIENASREPEFIDRARCLVAMGAKIDGIGTERLTVQGVERLHGATYAVMADRIEAGSDACAAAITGGEVELAGAQSESMEAVLDGLRRAGVVVEEVGGGLLVKADGGLRGVNLSTAP